MAQGLEDEPNNGKYDTRNTLNDLTGKEWIKETKSYIYQKGLGKDHPDSEYEKLHPAPFSFTDISRFISFFTKENQKVLDPFAGVGSTLKAAISLNREGFGVELIEKWVELSRKRLKKESNYEIDNDHLITGDSRHIDQYFEKNNFDLIITSPPYWNILEKVDHKASTRKDNGLPVKYSEQDSDIGNITDYDDFLDTLVDIFEKCYELLKTKKHLIIIVGDFRHKSKLIPFHSHLIDRLSGKNANVNFVLKGNKIILQRAKSLFPYGYPYAYVENIHHQYAIILRKE